VAANRLDDHVALVTGAAGGLGRAFCTALTRAGAKVAGVDIADMSGTAAEIGRQAAFLDVAADVTDPDAMRAACASVSHEFGKLDIVIANAGAYPSMPFEEATLEEWRRVMTLNLDGTFVTVQAALPYLRQAGWGRVVVISSSTVWLGVPTLVPYVTTKMGLIGFTRALAVELGDHDITVNAITPGLTETEQVLGSWVGQQFDWVVQNQVVKRRGRPEDLISTLLYLCDDDSGFITGQTINVDGGLAKH
jgi:NAD(P)-dependent dehydrogenase (short-subunit alcohol dehydrogenase family)